MTITDAERSIIDYWRANNVPGIAVAAARHGTIVLNSAHGDRERLGPSQSRPVTERTHFRIASLSKAVTATVAMAMVERGELDLDAPVSRYLDDFWIRERGGPTIRELLGHTGGVRHYDGRNATSRTGYENRRFRIQHDVVPLLKECGSVGTPGQQYHYSTHGYTVLGAAMEMAGNERFPSLVERELRTLGYGRPRCDGKFEVGEDIESSDLLIPDTWMSARPDCLQWKWAGGGMHATAEGMCRFATAVLDGSLISPVLRDEMWTVHRLADGQRNSENYSLGWDIGSGAAGIVHNSGQQAGADAHIRIDRNSGIVVVALSNYRGHPVESLTGDVMNDLRHEFRAIPRPPNPNSVIRGLHRVGTAPARPAWHTREHQRAG